MSIKNVHILWFDLGEEEQEVSRSVADFKLECNPFVPNI